MKITKKLNIVFVFVVLSLLASVCLPVFADNPKTEEIHEVKASYSDLYVKINPSVVYIYVGKAVGSVGTSYRNEYEFDFDDFFGRGFKDFFRQFEEEEEDDDFGKIKNKKDEQQLTYGSGTGFVWDEEGHIVTNNHVVEDAVEVTVTYSDGIQRKASVIGADPDSDLAVLEVENPKEGLLPVTMGDSSILKPGDFAAAIGNPMGQTGTMTHGIISALGRSYAVGENDGSGNYTIPDVIQTDAAINPGNSGGVLINADGEVVGVVMAFSSYSYSSAGIGYAIPSNLVKRVVPALIEKGEYEHPWIGFSGVALTPVINKQLELDHDQRGAYIQAIQPDSPAEKAGIQGGTEEMEITKGTNIRIGGDIITKINDHDVKTMDDIIAYLSSNTAIADTITLHLIRDGKEMDVEVTLAPRPNAAQRHAGISEKISEGIGNDQKTGKASLGVFISELSEESTGVLVDSVMEDSAAGDAGIKEGDIITVFDSVKVNSVQGLKDEIAKHQPGDRVSITILRDGEQKDIRLTLGNTISK